jgi:hypothetical protein
MVSYSPDQVFRSYPVSKSGSTSKCILFHCVYIYIYTQYTYTLCIDVYTRRIMCIVYAVLSYIIINKNILPEDIRTVSMCLALYMTQILALSVDHTSKISKCVLVNVRFMHLNSP